MTRRAVAVLAIAAAAGTWALAVSRGVGGPPADARAALRCGVERWPVKTLSDRDAGRVDLRPRPTSVIALRGVAHPRRLPPDRRVAPFELRTYRIVALLLAAKREPDRDVHLVVADRRDRSKTMIVELPDVACSGADRSRRRDAMLRARRAFERACGGPPSTGFATLSGTATITGVGFIDFVHGQRGVAPNGVELHPVVRFSTSRCRSG
jgi:hypothetical protein